MENEEGGVASITGEVEVTGSVEDHGGIANINNEGVGEQEGEGAAGMRWGVKNSKATTIYKQLLDRRRKDKFLGN